VAYYFTPKPEAKFLATTGIDFITRKRLHQEFFNALQLVVLAETNY
jgi:hypothetical protein